jgi:hypothetical protein
MGNINFPGGELWETLGKTLGWENLGQKKDRKRKKIFKLKL